MRLRLFFSRTKKRVKPNLAAGGCATRPKHSAKSLGRAVATHPTDLPPWHRTSVRGLFSFFRP